MPRYEMKCDTCDHSETLVISVAEYELLPDTCPLPECTGKFKQVISTPYLTKAACPTRTSTMSTMKALPQ